MSDRIESIHSREIQRNKFPVIFRNDSDEIVPPFGIMQISGATGISPSEGHFFLVVKPTGGNGEYLVNGPMSVRPDQKGRGRMASPLVLRYEETEPSLGDDIGPIEDSWAASLEGSDYTVLAAYTTPKLALCLHVGGGNTSNIRFARVTTAFDLADGPLEADWTDGQVKFQNDSTGELAAEPTDCKNSVIGVEWVEDAQVQVDTGDSPPRVINGTCTAVDWGD